MPLYQLNDDGIEKIREESFAKLRIDERRDLQRILRNHISAIAPNLLIVAEEFSEWEDSRRRIDLLGVDRDGSLVVIELKRTEDGGHMDLQALRYAAMISSLNYSRIVQVFDKFLKNQKRNDDAEALLLEHLNVSFDPAEIAWKVRIILVAGDFNTEITTAVLWLRDTYGVDIECVRLIPYLHKEDILIDIQHIIPLPEAIDYTVKLREKKVEEQKLHARPQDRDFTKFTVTTGDAVAQHLSKRSAIFKLVSFLIGKGATPQEIHASLPEKRNPFYKVLGKVEGEAFIEAALTQSSELGQSFDSGRWFTAPGECFHEGGSTYVFTKMWGSQTVDCMRALVEKYSSQGISFEAEKSDSALATGPSLFR